MDGNFKIEAVLHLWVLWPFPSVERKLKTPAPHQQASPFRLSVCLCVLKPHAWSQVTLKLQEKHYPNMPNPSSEAHRFLTGSFLAPFKLQTYLLHFHFCGDMNKFTFKISLKAFHSSPLWEEDTFLFVSCWSNLQNYKRNQEELMQELAEDDDSYKTLSYF